MSAAKDNGTGVGRGRPSRYSIEMDEAAFRYTLLGLTDVQMAGLFGVSIDVFDGMKKKHPSFARSLKDGKEDADAKVVRSLYQKALGFTKEVQRSTKDGVVTVEEYYPPDTAAAFIWLKNRAGWRDRKDLDMTVHDYKVIPADGQLILEDDEIDD